MIATLMAAALMAATLAASPTPPIEITAPGQEGPLAGTLIDPDPKAPLVLIVPGSGPTDRDGNNRLGVAGGPYKQLAESLAANGIASVRIDKRGMFGSKAAVADVYASTTSGYADDVHAWSAAIAKRTGRSCVWVLGHSEGGLVALVAAQRPAGICGLILLGASGRPIGTVMREQLRANPANAPFLPPALAAIDSLEAGKRIDATGLPAPFQALFAAKVQPYLIDLFAHDPARLIAGVNRPVLILQGMRDIQVSVTDARTLAAADPKAALTLLPGVNHVLKPVTTDDRAANIAAYANAALPIDPSIAAAIVRFVGTSQN